VLDNMMQNNTEKMLQHLNNGYCSIWQVN